MTLTAAALGFAVVAGLMTITPGLDTTIVLRTAIASGSRAAWSAAFGVTAGVLAWAAAAAAGVSAVVTASETAAAVLRWGGAAYLAFLGARMLVAAWRDRGIHPDSAPALVAPGAAFRQGLLTNLLNPKVGAFYVALLPQFLPQGHSALLVGLLLGMVHNLEGILWFGLVIALAARMRRWLARPGVRRGIDAVAGVAVLGFGAKLAVSARQ
jgi:threonine/homoserine/homoserine lactone efflux protein